MLIIGQGVDDYILDSEGTFTSGLPKIKVQGALIKKEPSSLYYYCLYTVCTLHCGC